MKYYLLLFGIVLLFFNQIFFGKIPFPGDLLVSLYEPYRAYPISSYPPAGVPTKAQGADVVRHMFPWKKFSVDSFKNGEIPFWNPHNFSGNPLMGNFQSGVFYPFNFLFFILPLIPAWTVYIFLIPFLSSLFMYFFLRELKLSHLSSIFGGLVFAFSSYMTVWLEWGNIGHTFLWFPLTLYLTEKLIKNFKVKYIAFLILALTTSLLAGYIQIYFYMSLIILIYYIVKTSSSFSTRNFVSFIFALIFPIIFSLFQILPTIDLFNESSRDSYTISEIQNLLNPWWYLVTTVVPNFFGNPASFNHWFSGTYIERVSYIGLIPFVFSLYALMNFKKRLEIKIFGAVAIVSLFLATDFFLSKYFFMIPFPIISTTVPTRILSLFQFSGAVLGAIGFDYLRKNANRKFLNISLLLIFLVLFCSWVFTFLAKNGFDSSNLEVTRRNLMIPTVLFLLTLGSIYIWKRSQQKIIPIFLFILTIFDLFYFFNKITPFSPKEFVYPQMPVISFLQKNAGIYRFWGYGSGYVESNFQTYDGTFSPDGVDPIHIKRYTRLLEAARSGKITMDLPRPDANIPQGFGKEDLRNNKYRQRLLNLLGVKYVLNKTNSDKEDFETFPGSIYRLVYHDGYFQIYENKEALPRAFLAGNYIVEKDRQKIVDHIFDVQLDLKKTLVLEEDPKIKFADDTNSKVILTKYGNNEVSFKTSAKTNMLLFLSDTYFYKWKTMVDGKPSPLFRADYSFRAVAVPAGEHEVIFRYESQSFKYGLIISSFGFIAFLTGILFLAKYRKL